MDAGRGQVTNDGDLFFVMNPEYLNHFCALAQSMGVSLTVSQSQQFGQFSALLQRWNTAYNLTRIEPGHDTVTAHLLDSLSANPYLFGTRMLDVGTGAGFPGIPLAIIRPDCQFTLMDSNRKKTRFVLQVQIELNLRNVDVVPARIEEWQPPVLVDTVITRAVSEIKTTLAHAQHVLQPAGRFVFMKGQLPATELQSLPPGYKVVQLDAITVPELDAARHIIVVGRDDDARDAIEVAT